MQMLPPHAARETLDDLTVQVALVRPGPIQGGAVHPYIERRKRLREDPDYEVPYEHPSLEPVLARHARRDRLPGPGDRGGDGARRLHRRRGRGAAARDEPQALGGGDARLPASVRRGRDASAGSTRAVAERVFEQVRGFSGFGFPKAHAAAFGLLAYQSTWLRVHYGPEFLCALLNEQPMGFYPPDALVHEAQRRGIEVRPPDVNRSGVECTVEVRAQGGSPCASASATSRASPRRRRGRSSPSASAAAPTASPATSPRARAPGATGSSGSRGRAPATRSAGRSGSARRREELWRLGVARGGAAAARAAARQLALPLPLPASPELRAARSLGADAGRLRLDRDRRSASTRSECCGPSSTPGWLAAATCAASPDGSAVRWPGWSSPASAPRPPRGSSSCCSRTRSGRST